MSSTCQKIQFQNEFYPDGIEEEYLFKIGNTYVTKCLGILLTNTCNAECSLCCASSSPFDKRTIPQKKVLDLIRQAKELGFIQIGLSGGEVMLKYREMLEIGQLCSELGLTFTIATNGFWARDKESARKKLINLRKLGLVKIHASFDESHSEYIDRDTFINLLDICTTEKIGVEIYSAYFKNGKKLADLLGDKVCSKYKVFESPVVRSGRAFKIPQEDFVTIKGIPAKTCPKPSQIVVDYDGYVYPCCSVSGFTENIRIGGIETHSLSQIVDSFKKNTFLNYIQKRGFSELLPSVLEELEITAPPMLTTCEVCMYVGRNKQISSMLNKKIHDEYSNYYSYKISKLLEQA